jgi:transcription termination factor NusB
MDTELTPDGIPTIEKQLKDIEESERVFKSILDTEKTIDNHFKNMLKRVKFLGLYKMNKDPFMNTSNMSSIEKKILQRKMNEYAGYTETDIITEYNEICCELLSDAKTNYTQFMVSYY